MSRLRFVPIDREVEVAEGETILDAARREAVPVGTSCGGIGICRRCRVTIVDGAANLEPMTTIERDQARLAHFGENERLACQTVVRGDCTVTTTYW
jgi:ferredoxin